MREDVTKAPAQIRNRIVKALIKAIEAWCPKILKGEYVRIERSNFCWQKHCLSRELLKLKETLARQADWLEEFAREGVFHGADAASYRRVVDVADQPLSSANLDMRQIATPRPSLRLVEKRKVAA